MKNLLFILLLSAHGAAAINRESGGAQKDAAAVFVNFRSLGNSIDSDSLKIADELINKADADGFVKEIVRTSWGHENEITICIQFQGGNFNGVGPSREFVKNLAPSILKDTQPRTDVLIGLSCDDITKATKQDLTKYVQSDRSNPLEVPLADKVSFKTAMTAFVEKHRSPEAAVGCELKIREQSSSSRYFFDIQDLDSYDSNEFALIIMDAQRDHKMSTIVKYRINAHGETDRLSIVADEKSVLYEHSFDGYFDDVIRLKITENEHGNQKYKFDYSKYRGDKIMGLHCEITN